MDRFYNYIFEGNTIYDVTGYTSALFITGTFTSFSFRNNSFRDIYSSISDNYAGVFFFFFF
jgi:hypothetical protein